MTFGLLRIGLVSPLVCDRGMRENEPSPVGALETEPQPHARCFGIAAQGPDRWRPLRSACCGSGRPTVRVTGGSVERWD